MEENKIEETKVEEKEISKFRKYLICIKKSWLMILMLSLIGIFVGLVIANRTFKKPYEENNYCVLNFKYTNEIDLNYKDIISENNIKRCKTITKSLETGSKISTYQYVDIIDIRIEKNSDYYTIYANKDSFNVSQTYEYSDSAAKGFLKHLTVLLLITDEEIADYNQSEVKGHSVFTNFDKEFYNANSLDSDGKLIINYSNPEATKLNNNAKITYHVIWISSSCGVLFLLSFLFIFIFIDKLDLNIKREYDNNTKYRTPFHRSFFRNSLKTFNNLKSLIIISLLLGLVMISKFIPIPSGFGQLGISFGFLFLATACMLYGPYPALLIGLLSDVIGFLIHPTGSFFIGYTFQAMLACFFYALCLHKTYITFTRCFIARVGVNIICNAIIGTICHAIINSFSFDATMTYFLLTSLPKNLIYLLPQSALLYFVLKALAIPLSSLKLMRPEVAKNISFF